MRAFGPDGPPSPAPAPFVIHPQGSTNLCSPQAQGPLNPPDRDREGNRGPSGLWAAGLVFPSPSHVLGPIFQLSCKISNFLQTIIDHLVEALALSPRVSEPAGSSGWAVSIHTPVDTGQRSSRTYIPLARG